MNLEERILAVFSGEKPDVMPWFADLTYWYNAKLYWGELPTKYLGERGRIRLYRELGCGSHEELYNLPGKIKYYNVKRVTSVEEFRDGTVIYEDSYHTPVGNITTVRKFVPRSVSSAIVKHAVATRQDLKVLQYIYRNQEFKPDFSLQYERLKNWRGIGFVSSLPPRTPFQRLIVEWAGVMNTLSLMMREREELEETIHVMSEADDPIYEAICESPAPGVYFGENITSEVVSPTIFRRYHMPYYKKRAHQLHNAKKYIYVHIDGMLRGVLPLLGESGVDCAQSVTPAPVGDIPVEKLREVAGPNIILWGGLPGVYFSCQYSEKILRQMAMDVIKHHLEGHKFIMGVADQVPPDGDIKRVKMVTDLVEKYARYY
ncbi:MAG: uroporphyrinogen decarboxylase family protein [Candidatus Bathyarchaeia archaeon]